MMPLLKKLNLPKFQGGRLIVFLVILLAFCLLQTSSFLKDFESNILDFYFNFRGNIPEYPKINCIQIGETEIDAYGRDLGFHRYHHADLLDALKYYGAKAVVFDIMFYDETTATHELIGKDGETVDLDARFGDALRRTDFAYLATEVIYKSNKPIAIKEVISVLSKAAKGLGNIAYIADEKGIARKAPLVTQFGEKPFYHLSLLGACEYLELDIEKDLSLSPNKRNLILSLPDGNEIRIPLDKDGLLYVNWCGPWRETFNHFSYYDVIETYKSEIENTPFSRVNPKEEKKIKAALKGSICIIGATATGLFDTKATPFDPIYPMMGIHANLISNVLQQDFLRMAPPLANILIIIVLSLVIYLMIPRFSISKGLLALIIWFALFLGFSFLMFAHFRIWVDVFHPIAAGLITYITIILYQYFFEQKDKRLIKGVLQKYVSQSVMENVLKHPDKLKLGGDKKELTISFCDIRGFTSFSEKNTPEDVVEVLNFYLSLISNKILSRGGTVDKFIGDCIMFFFGAPVEQPEHAKKSVETAIDIQRTMAEYNRKRRREKQTTIHVGIGINSGDSIIGHIGTQDRMDYTVIGDNVNLAARLEAVAKKGQIIISGSTYESVKGHFTVTPLEPVKVKGKTNPIVIYEVVYEA